MVPKPSRGLWRRLAGYLAPYKGQLVLAFLTKTAAAALALALPVIVQKVVDSVLENEDLSHLNTVTLMLLGLFGVLGLISVVGNYHVSYIGERIVIDLRRQLYAHLQTLPLRFYTERRVGELVSRMSSDVTVLRNALANNLIRVVRQTLTLIGGIIFMTVLNWRLMAFIMIVTPVIFLFGAVLSRFSRRGSTTVQDEIAAATVVAEEAFQNIREVKSFVREPFEVARYNAAIDRGFRALIRLIRIRAVIGPMVDFMFELAFVLVLWYGGREVLAGRLSSGELVAFVVYLAIVGQVFSELSVVYTQFQEMLGASQRVFELLDTVPDLQDAPDALKLDTVEGRITFADVDFSYDGTHPVLSGLDLVIAPGEIVALVGPSGAGKTTVFNLIPRFYDVTGGALCVDGVDVRQVTQASLRAQIGIVPQETLLFGGTIHENIRYGRLDASEDELIAAARAANAHDFIVGLPDGYATVVGERGVRLSGGQRQRVAIARAILKDPRILLLDEATSSLDNESELLVQEALERLMQSRTTIIIAHRLSTVRVAHRIAVLDAGRLVELGTHDALMAQNGLYARLYEMQFREQDLLAVNGAG
ncbi:MAG: ATP-binding cassette domain-containing protein [Anaerolineae bacterium]|nr:ATP-binding cassette domain-containing protein [Anaerolineae bacterium]